MKLLWQLSTNLSNFLGKFFDFPLWKMLFPSFHGADANWVVCLSPLIIPSLRLKLFRAARGKATLTKRLGNRSEHEKREQIFAEKFIWKQPQSRGWLQEEQRSWRDLKVSSEECEEGEVEKMEWSEDPARAEMLPSLFFPSACHSPTLSPFFCSRILILTLPTPTRWSENDCKTGSLLAAREVQIKF